MRAALFLTIALPLAGCQDIVAGTNRAPQGGPSEGTRIVEARATATRVILKLSDGARCVGLRPDEAAAGWSGVTADCGYELPYTVTFRSGGDPTRFTIEESFGTADAEGRPGPRAEIFVTDVDGTRRLFLSPLPAGTRFKPVGEAAS